LNKYKNSFDYLNTLKNSNIITIFIIVKNNMKLLALTLLQVIEAFKYDGTQSGSCPYKPGDLATKV